MFVNQSSDIQVYVLLLELLLHCLSLISQGCGGSSSSGSYPGVHSASHSATGRFFRCSISVLRACASIQSLVRRQKKFARGMKPQQMAILKGEFNIYAEVEYLPTPLYRHFFRRCALSYILHPDTSNDHICTQVQLV